MGDHVGGVGFGSISFITLLIVFVILWIYLGNQSRKKEKHLHKLKMNRTAQLQKLKAEKRAEQAAKVNNSD